MVTPALLPSWRFTTVRSLRDINMRLSLFVSMFLWWIGWLQNSDLLVPGLTTPGAEALCAEDSSLLHAAGTVADCAADYRFV